jgi:hypothetical protein
VRNYFARPRGPPINPRREQPPEELIGADGEVGVQKDFQKSYKIPKRTKRSRLLRFRTRGFVHQERRFRVKNHKLCKNKRR